MKQVDMVSINDYLEYLELQIQSQKRSIDAKLHGIDTHSSLFIAVDSYLMKEALQKLEGEVCRCKYQSMQNCTHININGGLVSPENFYYWYINTKAQ